MKPIRCTCVPRAEVLKGDLEEGIFAADFGLVLEGAGAEVYRAPARFFGNTHPAAPLKKVVTAIFSRLADPNEAGTAVRLSTGFGGGKSHTLIALWHLARNIKDMTLGTELLPAAGRPHSVVVAGVDGEKMGATVCGRHGDLVTKSLWGELAFQLGQEAAYAKVASVDDPETAPDAAIVRALLPSDTPVLILIDELVKYMVTLSERGQGALLKFVGLLISEIGARHQAVLVITDPASQMAYQQQATALASAVQQAASRLDDELGRKTSDYDPIGNEAAQVIVRRLFEKVEKSATDAVSAEYYNAYTRIAKEAPDAVPPEAATTDYAARIVECYPFHPRLLETAQNRLGALQDFQKSRGTLRLFGRILRDIWERSADIELVTAGDLDWASDRIQAELLQRLNRDQFKAAVDADVIGHAAKLDSEFTTDIHRRVAAALLLESLPMNPNAAMDKRDLTLATLRPSEVGHEAGEAIDRLLSVCWHTYKDDTGRRYQFRYEPNANKLIEERAESILTADARADVLTLAQGYFGGNTFKLIAYPASPRAVSDTADLKLVLGDTEAFAQAVCDYEDDSEPDAKRPRRFRNAIFGVAPTHLALEEAIQAVRLSKAADEINKEHAKNKALKEQLATLVPTLRRRARIRTIRAFNRVVFQGRPSVTLDEKYLVSDESPLDVTSGQAALKQFLDDKKLVYQPTDALDADLLVDSIMKGATPSLDHEGAYPADRVHERALASDKLRLMRNADPIRNAILRAVEQGKVVVRLSSGDAYNENGCVTGAAGARRRIEKKLTTLKMDSDVLLAPKDAPCVADWLKVVDAVKEPPPTPPPPGGGWIPNRTVIATTWGDAIGHAAKRPLRSLTLRAPKIEAAKTLIGLAQPFGAQSLTLSVSAGGDLKDGGSVQFLARDLKHNHALKPLDTASMLLRAMGEDATFNAELALSFTNGGATDTESKLEQAQNTASPEVEIEAEFGEEPEA